MKSFATTHRFKRDYRALKKAVRDLDKKMEPVIRALVTGEKLPEKSRDHPLGGECKGFRDCHVAPDLALIYAVRGSEVTLVRLGSHSDLFG